MDTKEYFERMRSKFQKIYENLIDEVTGNVGVPITTTVEDVYLGSVVLFSPVLGFYLKETRFEDVTGVVVTAYCSHIENVHHRYEMQPGDQLLLYANVGMEVGREFLTAEPLVLTVDAEGKWFSILRERMDEIGDLIAQQGPAIADGLNNFERYVEEDRRAAEKRYQHE